MAELTPEQRQVKDKRITTIIEELRGTPKALHEVMTEYEQIDEDILDAIDGELFLCSKCDWWCEISEEAESSLAADTFEPFCDDHEGESPDD